MCFIIGDVNFDHLVKVLSVKYFHHKATIFLLFVIYKKTCFETMEILMLHQTFILSNGRTF